MPTSLLTTCYFFLIATHHHHHHHHGDSASVGGAAVASISDNSAPESEVRALRARVQELEEQLLQQHRNNHKKDNKSDADSKSADYKSEDGSRWVASMLSGGTGDGEPLQQPGLPKEPATSTSSKDDKDSSHHHLYHHHHHHQHAQLVESDTDTYATGVSSEAKALPAVLPNNTVIQSQPGRIHSNTATPPEVSSRRHYAAVAESIPENKSATAGHTAGITTTTMYTSAKDEAKLSKTEFSDSSVASRLETDAPPPNALQFDDGSLIVVHAGVWDIMQRHRDEVKQLQLERKVADEKAVELHLLLEKAAKRLLAVTSRHRQTEAELEGQKQQVQKLSGDLRSTKQEYDKMIEELTVHVCNLTEKLASKDALL
mmetsp:Transcript_2650/g.4884  ORF Transcript_2650/g.4884 Transcript_2650/m.4884 type:complete len:372 (+) Transcript_2650:111-1226(+)